MSCNCSSAKVAVCQAGAYSLVKIALPMSGMSKSEDGKTNVKRKKVLMDSIVVGGSSMIYDRIRNSLMSYNTSGMVLSDEMMKLIYQVVILELVRMFGKGKVSVPDILENAVALAASIYGLERL